MNPIHQALPTLSTDAAGRTKIAAQLRLGLVFWTKGEDRYIAEPTNADLQDSVGLPVDPVGSRLFTSASVWGWIVRHLSFEHRQPLTTAFYHSVRLAKLLEQSESNVPDELIDALTNLSRREAMDLIRAFATVVEELPVTGDEPKAFLELSRTAKSALRKLVSVQNAARSSRAAVEKEAQAKEAHALRGAREHGLATCQPGRFDNVQTPREVFDANKAVQIVAKIIARRSAEDRARLLIGLASGFIRADLSSGRGSGQYTVTHALKLAQELLDKVGEVARG